MTKTLVQGPRCQTCGDTEADGAWQPFGPDSDPMTFMMLGSHYRGFPVIKVCWPCAEAIKDGLITEFTYRKVKYLIQDKLTFTVIR